MSEPTIFAQVVAEVLYRNLWGSDWDDEDADVVAECHALADTDAADVLHALATDPRVREALITHAANEAHTHEYGEVLSKSTWTAGAGWWVDAILAALDPEKEAS